MGYRTLIEKQCPVVFKVQNISPEGKTIKVFHTPIGWGKVRDLLAIPNVSEDVIRHSLLKGDLNIKIRTNEIYITESNIELYQFDLCHRQFLIDAGINIGVDPGTSSMPFIFKQQIELIGTKNSINRIFTTVDKFINGSYGNNVFKISIKHNGRDLVEGIDYMVAESGGVGTGYDTVILNFAPKARSVLVADYVLMA